MNLSFNIYTALVIIGVFVVINWEGMLLHFIYRGYSFVYDFFNFNINAELSTENVEASRAAKIFAYLCKPLFTCPYCMASVWTVIAYVATGKGFDWFILADMLCTCGIVTVLFSAINYFRGE